MTRRSGDLPKEGDEHLLHQSQTIFKPQNLAINANSILDDNEQPDPDHDEDSNPEPDKPETPFEQLWEAAYGADPIPNEVLNNMRRGVRRSKHLPIGECSEENSKLVYQKPLYVPDYDPHKLQIMREAHSNRAAGHPGRCKTLELVTRTHFWPKMRWDVEQFVKHCHTCQRSRTSRHAPIGILRPLPIPDGPWKDLSIDFVTGLPWSDGYNAILVVTCRLTKMHHLIHCRDTTTAEQLAELFLEHVFRLQGLPRSIVSDRGTKFVAKFWKALCKRLDIQARLSNPYHPQTDGQTEHFHAIMEQYLCCFVNYLQDNWNSWLPLSEFAANNKASESTGVSPFFANYGYDP